MERQYIGARYVPKFFENPNTGDSSWLTGIAYEALTIVTYAGNSYTSKKPVPAGIGSPNENPDYWVATGLYNAQIEQINERINELDTTVEELPQDILNKTVVYVPNSITASELQSIINGLGSHSTLVFRGIYNFDNAITIQNKNAFSMIGLGYCAFVFSGTNGINIINCQEHSRVEHIEIRINGTSYSADGYVDSNNYGLYAHNSNLLSLTDIRIITNRYAFYISNCVTPMMTRLTANIEFINASTHIPEEAIGFLLRSSNSAKLVDCFVSGAIGTVSGSGFYILGSEGEARDYSFINCEASTIGYGYVGNHVRGYAGNNHIIGCMFDQCSYRGIWLNFQATEFAEQNGYDIQSTYIYTTHPTDIAIFIVGNVPVTIEGCEFHGITGINNDAIVMINNTKFLDSHCSVFDAKSANITNSYFYAKLVTSVQEGGAFIYFSNSNGYLNGNVFKNATDQTPLRVNGSTFTEGHYLEL